jgi:glycerol-3-phosphate cytidylyltransferase
MTFKVGFICGAFDLFHAGHNFLLRECKTKCDYLIVGLHTDPTIDRPSTKNKPIQTVFERFVQLENSLHVDKIIPYETEKDLNNLLATIPINIRFLGEDYRGLNNFTGHIVCNQLGIEIEYIKRRHDFSTSELRKRIIDAGI